MNYTPVEKRSIQELVSMRGTLRELIDGYKLQGFPLDNCEVEPLVAELDEVNRLLALAQNKRPVRINH